MGILDIFNLRKTISNEVQEQLGQIDEPGELISGDNLPQKPMLEVDKSKDIGAKGIIDDPYFDIFSQSTIKKQKVSRIANRTLKDVSIRDWLVSAIIQARVDTAARFSRPEQNRLEMGFKFQKLDKDSECSIEELKEMKQLEQFVYNCGRIEDTPITEKMLFSEFIKLIVRDAVTIGHISVEKVRTRLGALHRFRPLPAESVYLINKKLNKEFLKRHIDAVKPLLQPGDNDPRKEQEINEAAIDYFRYVQMSIDERPLAVFGDEDMVFKLFNPQNFNDSNGYAYSPLELAIINITNHLNVENYNANFFTQGYAARGVLHLKGTVTQSSLANFRRQFYNSISGTQHAWRTPIVAGLDEVQWVAMSGSSKEMEYINFNNHLMRIICAQFQIDPMELGLDYLISGTGKAPTQQSNNEFKINYSRERGLYPILMFIEDFINHDIVPAIDPELAKKYKFVFTGFTDETPQTAIALMQAEMTVYKSMNDLLKTAGKPKLEIDGANLPLNQAFWALIEKNYTRGEIREKFFNDTGASKRKELAYIATDPAFIQWNQMLVQQDQLKMQMAQQAEMQKGQQAQLQQDQAQKDEEKKLKQQEMERKYKLEQESHDLQQKKLQMELARMQGEDINSVNNQ